MKTKLSPDQPEDTQTEAAAWPVQTALEDKRVPIHQAPARAGGDPTATLDDRQAATTLPEDDGCVPVTARLKPSVHQYLVDRARAHGETPEQHLGRILRAFRLTDPQRPDLARLPSAEVGMPAMARPR